MPLAIGADAPGFSGQDVQSGSTISLSDYAGKTVVLTFAGLTWCGYCRQEAPVLQELWSEYSASDPDRVQFIIISVNDSPDGLASAIEQYGLTMPVLMDDGIFSQYGSGGVPATYIIGPEGVVCNVAIGFHEAAELREAIEVCLPPEDDGSIDITDITDKALDLGSYLSAARVLVGVTGGGGGIVITPGGKLQKVPPRDPAERIKNARNDVLLAIGLDAVADHIADEGTRTAVKSQALSRASNAVAELAANARSAARMAVRPTSRPTSTRT